MSLTFSASPTSIDTIQFNPGAPGYTFNVAGTLNVNGTGIANNSSNTPNFVLNGTLDFFNSSTAGNATITNNGALNFFNASTAGNAIITSNSALVFHDNSTAGNAKVTGNASLTFLNSSSAGAAAIINNSSLDFFNSSTAGASIITSNSTLVFHDGSTAESTTMSRSDPNTSAVPPTKSVTAPSRYARISNAIHRLAASTPSMTRCGRKV